MGAWGAGSFENDAAGDWADTLLRSADAAPITEALAAANDCPGYLEADEAARAFAAAEVVAALCGRPSAQLAEPLVIWVHEHREAFYAELPRLAAAALSRIKSDSELEALWEDGGAGEWMEVVADLERRLDFGEDGPAVWPSPLGPDAAHPPLRLVRTGTAARLHPSLDASGLSPELIGTLRNEYRQLKALRMTWRLLSVSLGGAGIALILFLAPGKGDTRPFGDKEAFLAMLALILFALGLIFAGKAKGRGMWWGFTAFGRISLIRRAAERDLVADRLEELKRTLEAHGEQT